MISNKIIKINENTILHILKIETLSPKLEDLIDKNISKIHSNGHINLKRTKKILKDLLRSNNSGNLPDIKIGMIAEFFIHLYLNNQGFEQLCLFQNLESLNEIKKGHDGYYFFEEEKWIMESKSTRTIEIHKNIIKEAYDDLVKKVSGKNINSLGNVINPWNNAFNHLHRVNPGSSILNKIKKLEMDFIDENYGKINDFNIIPTSTIFLEESLMEQSSEEIKEEIGNYIESKKYQKGHILCITQSTVDIFLEYLNK